MLSVAPNRDAHRQRRATLGAGAHVFECAVVALVLAPLLGCDQIADPAVSASDQLLTHVAEESSSAVAPPVRVASAGASTLPADLPAITADSEVIDPEAAAAVPDWASGAIFYQIFPERFCNGDPTNDPTRESLEFPDNVSEDWSVTPWTSDWYARDDWEIARGDNFYDDGVFDRRYGGDLQGILDKLDYLKTLGVNALYLNPVFYARSLHKYDGNTYHHIDPHFGPDPAGDMALMEAETSDPETWNWTAADKLFLELLREAHQRGIRVVIDGVFNHTGRDFFAFADVVKNQADSPYADWYIVHSFDRPDTPFYEFKYKGWWGVETLPEFADNEAGDDLHPGPKAYVFDATRRWMDPDGDGDPSDGVDGWRLDVAAEVPIGFWTEWNAHCRQINPECYTVAEHWDDAARFLAEGGFSATMNYHGFAFPVKGYLIDGVLSASDTAKLLVDRMAEFPRERQYALQNLIDGHDTDRVASMIVNAPRDRPYLQPHRADYDISERATPRYWDQYDVRGPTATERRIQRMVALMQCTFVGPPMIYYGTEAGMWGADDPCDRMPMVWDELEYEPQQADPLGRERQTEAIKFDKNLFAFYSGLLHLRAARSSLQTGSLSVVYANDADQTLALRRTGDEETTYVLFNRGESPAEIEFPVAAIELQEIFTASGDPTQLEIQQNEDSVVVRLPALEGVVLLQQGSAE